MFINFLSIPFSFCVEARWRCQKVTINTSMRNIQPLCPDNMEYSSCADACPETCTSVRGQGQEVCKKSDIDMGCQPACVCHQGYILDGDKCVILSQCPCHHHGQTFYEGQSFFMDCTTWWVWEECEWTARNESIAVVTNSKYFDYFIWLEKSIIVITLLYTMALKTAPSNIFMQHLCGRTIMAMQRRGLPCDLLCLRRFSLHHVWWSQIWFPGHMWLCLSTIYRHCTQVHHHYPKYPMWN